MIYFLSALRHTKFPSQAPAPMDRSMGDDARLRQSNCASRAGLITPPRLAPCHRPYENRSEAGRIFPEINWLGLRDRRERQGTIHGGFAPFGTGEKHPRDLHPVRMRRRNPQCFTDTAKDLITLPKIHRLLQ